MSFLERKTKLYPLKKKIYQKAVDIATLTEKERMKKLIFFNKTNWFPLMSESKKDEDSRSSLIDSS